MAKDKHSLARFLDARRVSERLRCFGFAYFFDVARARGRDEEFKVRRLERSEQQLEDHREVEVLTCQLQAEWRRRRGGS